MTDTLIRLTNVVEGHPVLRTSNPLSIYSKNIRGLAASLILTFLTTQQVHLRLRQILTFQGTLSGDTASCEVIAGNDTLLELFFKAGAMAFGGTHSLVKNISKTLSKEH